MPRQFAMSWEGHPHYRWSKMYKGTRYRVNCTDLPNVGTKYTREATASAANAWWELKRAEIDLAEHQAHPQRKQLDELQDRLVVGQALDVPAAELREVQADLERAEAGGIDRDVMKLTAAGYLNEPTLAADVFAKEAVWAERKRVARKGTGGKAAPTFGELGKRWLARRRAKHQAGNLSVSGTAQSKYRLDKFLAWIGPPAPAAEITAPRWEEWYLALQGQVAAGSMSNEWGKNIYATSKQFVRWLYETEVLDRLPRNFDSIRWEGKGVKEIKVFEPMDVTAMLAAASPRTRLYLMLMAGAGMYQSDISDLKRAEVDLVAGTITRKRSKTKDQENVPTVTYTLWPETVELLRQFMEKDGEYALLNEEGQKLVREKLKDDGTHTKTDAIRLAFDRVKAKKGLAGTIKMFRKTSASILNRYPEYEGIVPYFLGHAGRTVADRHYSRKSNERLAEAVAHLRNVYGVEKLPK